MKGSSAVLIVDDEKNIRITLSMALEALKIPVDTAENGEEALQKLKEKSFSLMLLDLKLPGMDGLEVLRWVTDKYPNLMTIIITAYGSIEVAVEAMKLGVVRDMVRRVMQAPPEGRPARKYDYYVGLAKQSISVGELEVARVYATKAAFITWNRPEAYNLLGGICEAKGDRHEADKNYRVALELDPTYEPARKNLERVTSRPYSRLGIVWD
jgi:CheY-like chemotaxis protein